MGTLTRSGAGLLIEPAGIDRPDIVAHIEGLIERHGFLVLKGALRSVSDAVEFMGQFGPINEASTRKDGAVMVEDQDGAEVFRSRSALPLHKDGVLTGLDVLLVGIYCVSFEQVTGGRTYISDAMRALAGVPAEYVSILRENGLEGMAVDNTGYYRREYEGAWHPFPAFKGKPGKEKTLNIGLPAAQGEPASWLVRVANVDPPLSDRILASLRSCLLNAEYTYFHDWAEGDILLMDNYQVLHGREAWNGRKRQLANIQVLSRPG